MADLTLKTYQNNFTETIKNHDEITTEYTTLVTLSSYHVKVYKHIEIVSALWSPIVLRFDNGKTITVPAGEIIVRDNFQHGGLIEIKYESEDDVSASGKITVTSW